MWDVAANTPSQASQELRSIREKLRLKQHELAAMLEVPFDRYRNYEYRNVPERVLDLARDILVRANGLRGVRQAPTGKLKVLGSTGAGDSPIYEPDEDFIFVPIEFVRNEYGATTVEANQFSMLPYIHPGDTLIFKRTDTPKLDKIIAVRLRGETESVVKKCTLVERRLVLRSYNPDYPDIPIDGSTVLGYLTGIVGVDGAFRLGPEDGGIDESYIESQLRSRLN